MGLGRRFRIHRSHRCRNQKEILELIMRCRLFNRNHHISSWPNNYKPIISYRQKLAGITGGLAAVTGSILPPFIIIYFLAPLLLNLNQEASRLFIESFLRRPGWCSGVCLLTALRWIKEAFEYGLVSFASFILMTILMLVKVHPLIALFVGFSMNMLLARKDKDA